MSSTSQFGTAPVGSSVQPCPLGIIEVEVARSDGQALREEVRFRLSGPEALDGSVPDDATPWRSPKIRPGGYRIEVEAGSTPKGWQAGAPVTCQLPTSGTATARLVLQPTATVPVKVVRRGSGAAVADVTVVLSQGGTSTTGITAVDGICRLVELPTSQPSYRVELSLESTVASRYKPCSARDITVVPGSNQQVVIELEPMAEITVKVIDPDSTSRRTVSCLVTATSASGSVEVATGTNGDAVFTGLAAGKYDITATPAPDSGYLSASSSSIELAAGAEKTVELTAIRARSRIVMSDKANKEAGRGLLWNMLAKPYSTARDELAAKFNRNTTILLPFSQLEFDDLYFDPDDAYWDDAKESIAITGWADFHGIRRQLLFAHTYRPNRLILAVKRKQWSFKQDWIKALQSSLTEKFAMDDAFLVLSASETSIKSDDLPPGVSSFFAQEEIDLKQGVNLYGKLDIKGFPTLDRVLGWMGIKESYVKIQGWLGHDASFAISKESIEKHEVHERAWELALAGTVPWRIPAGLEWLIKERELTLEVSKSREVKGHNLVRKMVGDSTPTAVEKKITVKLEDAITVPLPTLAVPWLVVVNEDKDVKFTGAFQVEHELEDKPKAGETPKPKGDDEEAKTQLSVEYGTDFTIALFGKNLAVHDFKAELNFTEEKLKLEGEIDLGRREKVAVVEFERKIGDGKKKAPAADAKSTPVVEGDKDTAAPESTATLDDKASKAQPEIPEAAPRAGDDKLPVVTGERDPATPPKPGVNLEEKANKPQPEAPTEDELAAAAATPKKESPWSVTVKLKPSVVMGLVDIIKDIAAHIKAQGSGG